MLEIWYLSVEDIDDLVAHVFSRVCEIYVVGDVEAHFVKDVEFQWQMMWKIIC